MGSLSWYAKVRFTGFLLSGSVAEPVSGIEEKVPEGEEENRDKGYFSGGPTRVGSGVLLEDIGRHCGAPYVDDQRRDAGYGNGVLECGEPPGFMLKQLKHGKLYPLGSRKEPHLVR